jgi:hypothetical protein
MYALVTDGTITKYFSYPKGFTLGDLQYPKDIFMKWSVEEKEAIGIYEVVFNDSNKKDEQWYINTNQSFAFADDVVTASYGTATPKAHADTLFTAQDETDGLGTEGEVATRGLKYNIIRNIKITAKNLLSETDWYVTRKAEKNTAIPSAITTWRNGIRTKQAAMETLITNASNTAAIETLHIYVNTADEGDPVVMARPLGEFPKLES